MDLTPRDKDKLLIFTAALLAERVEPAMELLQRIWRAWRPLAWGLAATAPRVWST